MHKTLFSPSHQNRRLNFLFKIIGGCGGCGGRGGRGGRGGWGGWSGRGGRVVGVDGVVRMVRVVRVRVILPEILKWQRFLKVIFTRGRYRSARAAKN